MEMNENAGKNEQIKGTRKNEQIKQKNQTSLHLK